MASTGDSFRSLWTADLYNKIQALLGKTTRATGAGPVSVTNTRDGTQIVVGRQRFPVSTIQGLLTGGAAPSVSDGTIVIDPYAWNAYSIQGAYFVLLTGSTTLTVQVDGTPVSWLTNIAVTGAGMPISIPSPVTDLTHVINPGAKLSIILSGSSSDATALSFSLNCPF